MFVNKKRLKTKLTRWQGDKVTRWQDDKAAPTLVSWRATSLRLERAGTTATSLTSCGQRIIRQFVIFFNIEEFYWFHTSLTDGQVSGWTLNLEFDSPLDDLQCFAGDVSPSSDGVSWEALWLRLEGFCLPQLWRGAKGHTKRGVNKLRDQPKVHWSVVPCEWDSDFQVGDTMDIPFQVRSISSLSTIVNVPQKWPWIVIVVNTLQPMFAIGSSPDLVYADLDGPGHSICGTGPSHYHWHEICRHRARP